MEGVLIVWFDVLDIFTFHNYGIVSCVLIIFFIYLLKVVEVEVVVVEGELGQDPHDAAVIDVSKPICLGFKIIFKH